MESLEMLHKGLSQSSCLCHIETRTILKQLDLGSVVTGQGIAEKSIRDQILVRLGLLTTLAERSHCSKVNQVQEALLTSDRFEHVNSLMSSTDQLVAYCARKCLGVLVLKLARNDPDRAAGFLRQAVIAILHPREDQDQKKTVSVINRTICTLDLLTNILRGKSSRSEDTDRDQPTLPCMPTSTSVDKQRSKSITHPHEENMSDIIAGCHDVINETILELCAVFSSPFAAASNQQCNSEHQQTFMTWVQSINTSSRHNICHAFLRLLYSYTKVEMKRDNNRKLSFIQATLPHLQAMLMTYCHGNGANLKVVLSVLIQCMAACAKAYESAKRDREVDTDEGRLQESLGASWRKLVAGICEGEWLEKMPYHEGPAGFGGTVFALGEMSKESPEEYSRGDRVLLRKLAWLVIVSLEFETVSSGMVSRQGSRHLDRVSRFIVSKLRVMSLCKEETSSQGRWIFEIFGDQDDALIGIMLSLLKISLSARTRHDEETPGSSSGGYIGKDEDISHHSHEIPAEKHTRCILDAHYVFIAFLDHMTWDHSILLDLLISTETDFIEYFIRYLRFVVTDWEGFVQVQRFCKKKGEDTTVAHTHISGSGSDGDDDDISDGDDDDDDDNGDDDDDGDDENDEDFVGGGYDVHVRKDVNDKVLDNAGDSFERDNGVTKDDIVSKDKLIAAANDEKLYEKTETQFAKSLENVPEKKRKTDSKEMNEHVARELKKTEVKGWLNISSPSIQVIEASCEEDDVPEKKNEPPNQLVSEVGCLDDTMTILIRLRLAVERLEKKGLFPFSAIPLIRLLVKVEDMYEAIDY